MKHNFVSLLLCSLLFTGVTKAQDNIKMIVGTYTNGSSKGIYSFNINQTNGDVEPIDTFAVTNPSYLTLSLDGSVIYAVSETNDENAALWSIGFDTELGKMTPLNNRLTKGKDPCYVSTNGNLVLTANYSSGSMSVFPLNDDGSLQPLSQLFSGSEKGIDNERQQEAHVHCADFTPDGEGVLATDFTGDALLRYAFVNETKLREMGKVAQFSPKSGPRHFVFSPDSRFVYVMSELSGAVSVYSYYKGKLTKKQELVADKSGARGGADVRLTPNGKFLYVSHRLKNDGITIYRVNTTNGLLTEVGFQETDSHPRSFNITPNGKLLLCACKDGKGIQVFKINANTGLLTNLNKTIEVDKATCVQFYPSVEVPDTGTGMFKVIEKTIEVAP
jgi:putative 6-phosphogluconolactonase